MFLASLAGNMLSVLFNVFSSVENTERGLVGEVIAVWLGAADAKVRSAHHFLDGACLLSLSVCI